jgi:hypothetical protein
MNVVIQGVQKGNHGGVLLMDGLTEFTVTVMMDGSKRMLWVNFGTIFFWTSGPNQLFCWAEGSLSKRRAACF